MSETVDVRLLGEQVKRLMDQFGMFKADFDVSAAILRRLDLTQGGVLEEVRGVHAQQQRVAVRLDSLEGKVDRILTILEAK